jgi:hypothetical protein
MFMVDANYVSLDDWKPSEKPKKKLIQSEWRKNKIQEDCNQDPGLDDFRKIKSAIKKGCNDHEIMINYGINAETIVAIKQDIYNPARGARHFHSYDLDLVKDGTKMFLEFQKIQDECYGIMQAMHFLNDILFNTAKDKKNFKDIFTGKKPYLKKVKKIEEDFDDEE